MTEVTFESDASSVFDQLEKQVLKSWTSSDVNQKDYRKSWCQYRNSSQENKENIEPLVDETSFTWDENVGIVEATGNESMEIVESLSTCAITTDDRSRDENSALDPPPVKRARIVKPVEACQSNPKPPLKCEPFSFVSRERENQERRDARRSYYELLTKKSSPPPFKARPAPKFKPLPVPTKKYELRSVTTPSQSPKEPNIKPNVLQPINLLKTNRLSISHSQAPRVASSIGSPVPTSVNTPKRTKCTKGDPKTPSTPVSTTPRPTKTLISSQSKILENKAGTPVPTKVPLRRGFSTTPSAEKRSTTVQHSKSMEEMPRKRTLTVPKAPQLSTATRARERKEFDEKMQEKLRQRDAVKRMEMATAQQYEQEKITQLRKSMIHKPAPVIKCPSTHPMLPVFVKRPHWI